MPEDRGPGSAPIAVVLVGLTGALILGVVLLRGSSSRGQTGAEEAGRAAERSSAEEARDRRAPGAASGPRREGRGDEGARGDRPRKGPVVDEAPGTTPEQRYKQRMNRAAGDYAEWARYPPWSQPMSAHISELVPNAVEPTFVPLKRPTDKKRSGVPVVQVRQDRMFVMPGDRPKVTVQMAVDGKLVPIRVTKAVLVPLQGEPPKPGSPVGEATFTDDGTNGDELSSDLVLTSLVHIPSVPPGLLTLVLSLETDTEPATATIQFTNTGAPPARFTGQIREAMEDGSLALYVGIQIKTAGRYVIRGRVYDETERAFALVTHNGPIDTRQTEVRLLVHGKLVLDEGAKSPFRLRDLEGFRLLEDAHPDREVMVGAAGPFVTKAYPASAFSDKEFESPTKQRDLEHLRDKAEKGPDPASSGGPPSE